MKKIIALLIIAVLAVSLAACGQERTNENTSDHSNSTIDIQKTESSMQTTDEMGQTLITLTIGDTVLEGYLNDSVPAKSLIAQLPLTVSLNDSDNDFCGGNLDIDYSESDVTSGYKNGDLAFWTPANNFVIFVSDEESSADTGNLVNLGHITSPQEMLDALEGRIDVTIALKSENSQTEQTQPNNTKSENVRIKITAGDTELFAELENNATTKALIEKMPMTLSMQDLYGREMCYRYGANALPTDNLRSDGYEVGDIAYWPPRGSLVILYKQNGEQFERQHIGHIRDGVEIFENTGDAEVTFEVVSD